MSIHGIIWLLFLHSSCVLNCCCFSLPMHVHIYCTLSDMLASMATVRKLLMRMRVQEEKLQILSMQPIAERLFSHVMLQKLSIW